MYFPFLSRKYVNTFLNKDLRTGNLDYLEVPTIPDALLVRI